ncbi:hypothetical protein [Marinobacter shengliensis]|uniref:hypothetical protein n=1 Tax=Marinobacter shengliensis TaxID=1389223 RepID=UPI001E360466|nr:hypothetical protein [Marinobacter shengliensis]MCD1628483.1 hypothetical protein [Marinobacter shengliensis]
MSLHPKAQEYLETLRALSPEQENNRSPSLDWWHGIWISCSTDPIKSPEAQALYVDKARAVEIRLKELEVIALIGGDV